MKILLNLMSMGMIGTIFASPTISGSNMKNLKQEIKIINYLEDGNIENAKKYISSAKKILKSCIDETESDAIHDCISHAIEQLEKLKTVIPSSDKSNNSFVDFALQQVKMARDKIDNNFLYNVYINNAIGALYNIIFN